MHAGDEDLFDDEAGGADDERDEFAEDASLDEDAEAEHESEPEGKEPEPGAQTGVGDAAAHDHDEQHEVGAGAEQLRPCLGNEKRFYIPVKARVELGGGSGEVVADKKLPAYPGSGEGKDEKQGSRTKGSGPAETTVFGGVSVPGGLVDHVERKQEQGGLAIDGGDEEEAGEETPMAAEIQEIHGEREEGEAGQVIDEAEVLHGVHDVGGTADDE